MKYPSSSLILLITMSVLCGCSTVRTVAPTEDGGQLVSSAPMAFAGESIMDPAYVPEGARGLKCFQSIMVSGDEVVETIAYGETCMWDSIRFVSQHRYNRHMFDEDKAGYEIGVLMGRYSKPTPWTDYVRQGDGWVQALATPVAIISTPFLLKKLGLGGGGGASASSSSRSSSTSIIGTP